MERCREDPATLDKHLLKKRRCSNATNNLYTYPVTLFCLPHFKILKTHTSPLNLVCVVTITHHDSNHLNHRYIATFLLILDGFLAYLGHFYLSFVYFSVGFLVAEDSAGQWLRRLRGHQNWFEVWHLSLADWEMDAYMLCVHTVIRVNKQVGQLNYILKKQTFRECLLMFFDNRDDHIVALVVLKSFKNV